MNTTSLIIYNQVNNFFSLPESKYSCDKCNKYVEITLDIPIIKKVCGFNVYSSICIKKIQDQYIFFFKITSTKLKIKKNNYYEFFTLEKNIQKLSVKNINKFVNCIVQILPKLYFNKLTGQFELELEFINESMRKLINYSNIKINNILGLDVFCYNNIDCGDCCVCYDKTLIKTSCSHFLCVDCWSKINNISMCPYCRKKKIKVSTIKIIKNS